MDKRILVQPYSRVLFRNTKEQASNAHRNVDASQNNSRSERNQTEYLHWTVPITQRSGKRRLPFGDRQQVSGCWERLEGWVMRAGGDSGRDWDRWTCIVFTVAMVSQVHTRVTLSDCTLVVCGFVAHKIHLNKPFKNWGELYVAAILSFMDSGSHDIFFLTLILKKVLWHFPPSLFCKTGQRDLRNGISYSVIFHVYRIPSGICLE